MTYTREILIMRSRVLKASIPVALGGLLLGAGTAHANENYYLSIGGAYGIASYYTESGAKKMNGYVHDTLADGHCAMLWMDFTTNPHQHHDAQAYIACGNGNQDWGVARSSTDSNINGIRTAVCITGVHGCYDQNGNQQEWPYVSWDAKTCWWYRVDSRANGKCGEGNPLG
ncbi:hypothetical protein [Streptomyces lycii]|uniref:Ricin B lectin domain-containing protein n=1 Tax=Streptomyces lycii TaxID=2654337 RepID=A0ABQ7FB05_9ACTN|nr:hypothetical protein [Streptomyces lycii]KAF4405930.1 hypothetical protein GCU69_27680 [Streptomyces lycii]